MKTENYNKGHLGEDFAAAYLQKKGYLIIDRNARTRFGELDIIALDPNSVLVFVEVKAKTGHAFGEPWEMVGRRKLMKVRRMAEIYMVMSRKYHVHTTSCRIDVIGVWLSKEGEVEKIEQWENVY